MDIVGADPIPEECPKKQLAGVVEMWAEGLQGVPRRPPWGEIELGVGRERDSVHWPGLLFYVWPRTLRGVRILHCTWSSGCFKSTFVKV